MSSFQHCRVLINKLADTPHKDRQTALRAIAERREVAIYFDQGTYFVYETTGHGKRQFMRLVTECGTVDDSRAVALKLLQADRA